MKIKELIELSVEELKDKEKSLRGELLDLRLKRAMQQLKNPLKLREVKRDIARVLTLLAQKEKP